LIYRYKNYMSMWFNFLVNVQINLNNQGTGSYPLLPQGWHFSMRRMPRYNPLKTPCFFKASSI